MSSPVGWAGASLLPAPPSTLLELEAGSSSFCWRVPHAVAKRSTTHAATRPHLDFTLIASAPAGWSPTRDDRIRRSQRAGRLPDQAYLLAEDGGQLHSTRSAIHAIVSAVSAGCAGRLHHVAEHEPDHHVDQHVDPVLLEMDLVGHHVLTDHLAGRPEQRLGVGRQQREQLALRTLAAAEDRVQQRVGAGQLEHPAGGRLDRADQVVGVVLEGRVDDLEEQLELAQHHRLGQLRLAADLVVDRLPADARPGRRAWPS